jgi:hypothetical protein
MAWWRNPRIAMPWQGVVEVAAAITILMALAHALFLTAIPGPLSASLSYLTLPLLLWIAIRFGLRESATAVALLSILIVGGAVRRHGPFADVSATMALILSQGYTAVAAVTAFALAAAVVERNRANSRLQDALTNVISGYIPICARCKKIREKDDAWRPVEEYVSKRTHAEFTHSICPSCARDLYGGLPSRTRKGAG